MLNIKNFKLIEPTKELLEKYSYPDIPAPLFLQSEDGRDWYECQQLFSDNTVKIMYAANNAVQAVVAKPVPARGNIYAASMLFPLNMSVAEIEGTLPDGFEIDTKSWVFDGETVYQDADLLAAYNLPRNKRALWARQSKAAGFAFTIQSSAALGNPRDGDSDKLLALQRYADVLRDVDLTVAEPVWPSAPEFLG